MYLPRILFVALLFTGCFLSPKLSGATSPAPNIVYILADDLGVGDVKCLNPQGKIATPHLDRLAAGGMIFTDAHSTSSVCTPTRYSILTGRYNWRTRLQNGVLNGFSPPLIARERLTVPALLKKNGYHTAAIGKWHLGLTMTRTNLDQPILDGPTTRGFDEYFGISASLDMPPYAFIHNDRFPAPVTAEKELYPNRRGPAAADFEAVDVLPTFTRKAVNYIRERTAEKKPFFLYLALASPHTPIAPTSEWQGKSKLTAYADFVMQTDAAVGEVLAALDQVGAGTNTLVIFTSDNGFAPAAGVAAHKELGHYPSKHFRGYKSDIWEGGHRVPFLVRWPAKIKPGTKSDALVSLSDLMATCADLLNVKLPANTGEDSVSFLPILSDPSRRERDTLVSHSINGRFAIRQDSWKLALCAGSGGWSEPTDANSQLSRPAVQLYEFSFETSENNNLMAKHPEIVARLTNLLEEQIANGRSTPGVKQTNDVKVIIEKPAVPPRKKQPTRQASTTN